ncbi:MAG: abortive infection family protein [Nostoc sp. DedSLP03]|uniref:abortive infection family protein n=1 Tax=Nostoc sp. DedSLP03 TaxID=3075400 RepID=UPI002AD3DDF2|nr:abortive infection family protein [Nostoc sp. DedSLP03]MDZ7963836.1 abortive infection family protein [Nostoc sp. DedSLP03]
MKISEQTISALGSIITGDAKLSPYRSGSQLVLFFNEFGLENIYGSGFPSRWYYAEEKLREFNDTPTMKNIVIATFDPRHFLGKEHSINAAVEHFNQFIEFDNYQLRPAGKKWEVYQLGGSQINLSHPYNNSVEITHIFIDEQIKKCDKKLTEGDFDGAITNARSFVETVLSAIEKEFDINPPEYDGNLPKLYRRVQKHLNLSPGQENLAECLQQILSGLTSIISGLATLRNTMSDSHVISYKPLEYHARLAVNSAKTLCDFLFETKEYQMQKKKNSAT